MKKLTDKVAVITGASKSIGAAIAKHLALEGASVVVNYASGKEDAERVVAEIVAAGGLAIAVGARVDQELEVTSLFGNTKAVYGHLDILINNAGFYGFSPLPALTADEYKRHFDVNVLGVLLVTKAALALFPESGGSVVNVSSIVSTVAPAYGSVYSGSKAAVDAITKSLAKELAPRKIRVNAINPGYVVTEGTAKFAGSDFEKQAIATNPFGRAGTTADITPPVVFLASDDAAWITGETLYVSGGAGI